MCFPPLAELVPHTPPMLLLDRVEHFEPDRIVCRAQVGEHDPFLHDGRVRAVVCLEYMAQAIAAHTGLLQRERGEPPRPGYLISVRALRLNRSFLNAGSALKVEASLILSDASSATFEATVESDGEQIAAGQISVFQPPAGELP